MREVEDFRVEEKALKTKQKDTSAFEARGENWTPESIESVGKLRKSYQMCWIWLRRT